MDRQLTKLSLFSGIGGDDLASDWAGIKTICCVENDLFCQKVILKHYPRMPIIGDIHDVTKQKVKELTGCEYVDIIGGGDPCQPRSVAGKRRGREDDRDLWKDMLRVIREFKPAWVVNENPTGRLSMDFNEVLSDLESIGYETRSFVIPACAVNAMHRRDRLFIIAHDNSKGELQPQGSIKNIGERDNLCITHHFDGNRIQGAIYTKNSNKEDVEWKDGETNRITSSLRFNGEIEPFLGRDIHGIPDWMDRIKALGNTCVPQQIYPIYKAIATIESELS